MASQPSGQKRPENSAASAPDTLYRKSTGSSHANPAFSPPTALVPTLQLKERNTVARQAKYRERLPQLGGGLFLTDGGLETTLIFAKAGSFLVSKLSSSSTT